MNCSEAVIYMLKKQETYDEAVFEDHHVHSYAAIEDRIPRALMDEVGEFLAELEPGWAAIELAIRFGKLNHAQKPDWCWWKHTVGKDDEARIIEEFADVVHFCLSRTIGKYGNGRYGVIRKDVESKEVGFNFMTENETPGYVVIRILYNISIDDPLAVLLLCKGLLHISWDEVVEAYDAKHEINLKRIEEKY